MDIRHRAEELLKRKLPSLRVVTDTTNFMNLITGDVVELEGRLFVIKGEAKEGRFGLDDQPKPWVKTALDMKDGSPKLLKLMFFEEFNLPLGGVRIHCYRSPTKESRILDLMRGDVRFMQGRTMLDSAGNNIRVLEKIRGLPFCDWLEEKTISHEAYYQTLMRQVLEDLVEACRAIGWLHMHGERHGDIRRDHLWLDKHQGLYRWIDFDYDFDFLESPFGLDLFGLGNIICFAVAKSDPTLHSLRRDHPGLIDSITQDDLSPVIAHRVFNLKKIYPYIPDELNHILMHFSNASPVFYETAHEIVNDLEMAVNALPQTEVEP